MEFINQNMQVLIAALVVLIVLIIALFVWRAVSPTVRGRRGQRLGISEYHELDKTRRLVLIRRDNVEHLLLIGGEQDLVVESRITVPGQAAAYVPEMRSEPRAEPISEAIPNIREDSGNRPPPRPPVFGDRRPPPLRSIDPSGPPLTPSDRNRDNDT